MVVSCEGVAECSHRGEEGVIVENTNPSGLWSNVLDGRPQGDEVVLVDGFVRVTGDTDEGNAVRSEEIFKCAEVVVGVVDNDSDEGRIAVGEPVVEGGQSLDKSVVVGGDAKHEVRESLRGVRWWYWKNERVAGETCDVCAVVQIDGGLFGQEGSIELGDGVAINVCRNLRGNTAARVDNIIREAELCTAQEVNVWTAGAGLQRRSQSRIGRRRGRVEFGLLF